MGRYSTSFGGRLSTSVKFRVIRSSIFSLFSVLHRFFHWNYQSRSLGYIYISTAAIRLLNYNMLETLFYKIGDSDNTPLYKIDVYCVWKLKSVMSAADVLSMYRVRGMLLRQVISAVLDEIFPVQRRSNFITVLYLYYSGGNLNLQIIHSVVISGSTIAILICKASVRILCCWLLSMNAFV